MIAASTTHTGQATLPDPRQRRAIRLRIGYEQREIAARLGVSRPTITRWEAGTVEPRGPARLAYAELLRSLDQSANASHRQHQHGFCVLRAGIHTAAVAWPAVDVHEFRQATTQRVDHSGERLSLIRRDRGRSLRLASTGAVISLREQGDAGNLICVEGSLGAILAADYRDDQLIGPRALPAVEQSMRELAARLGIHIPKTQAIVMRVDLAADVAFASHHVAQEFLRAVIPLRVRRTHARGKFSHGTGRLESVEWSHGGGVQLRVYDRSLTLERGGSLARYLPPAAGLVRVEAQIRPRRRKRRGLHHLDVDVLRDDFAARVGNLGHHLVTCGPSRAATERLVREFPILGTERLLGALEVIGHSGSAAYPTDRVYGDRLRELHAAGLAPNEHADASLDVGAVLQTAATCFEEPLAHATPTELAEISSNPFFDATNRANAANRRAYILDELERLLAEHGPVDQNSDIPPAAGRVAP